jgi:hypothetical protein
MSTTVAYIPMECLTNRDIHQHRFHPSLSGGPGLNNGSDGFVIGPQPKQPKHNSHKNPKLHSH